MRSLVDILQFVLFIALLGWLILRGAQSIGYNWQWARVTRYLWRNIDGVFYAGPLLKGLGVTLQISALALALTIAIGVFGACLRLSRSVSGQALTRAYVELIRNTPMLVQLYLFYFVLAPILGFDRFWTGVVCLAVFEGAFAIEIFRAGIEAVPSGQSEAAKSLGLRMAPVYRLVILPQALRIVLPPLAGLGVALVKHSAIVSVIAVFDLTGEARNVIADTFMTFEIWLTVAALYLIVTLTLSQMTGALERRLKA